MNKLMKRLNLSVQLSLITSYMCMYFLSVFNILQNIEHFCSVLFQCWVQDQRVRDQDRDQGQDRDQDLQLKIEIRISEIKIRYVRDQDQDHETTLNWISAA